MHFSEVEKRIEAAKQAVMAEAPLLHAEFGRAKGEIKHDGTKVTAIDLAISEHIQRAITEQFPQDQFFSEELAPTEAPVPVVAPSALVMIPPAVSTATKRSIGAPAHTMSTIWPSAPPSAGVHPWPSALW